MPVRAQGCDLYSAPHPGSVDCVMSLYQRSPIFLAPGTSFMKDSFSKDDCEGMVLGMFQVHYIYSALYVYYHYISSTPDHQALDPGGWGPLR